MLACPILFIQPWTFLFLTIDTSYCLLSFIFFRWVCKCDFFSSFSFSFFFLYPPLISFLLSSSFLRYWSFHIGIRATMDIGHFSVVSMVLWMSLLPPYFWNTEWCFGCCLGSRRWVLEFLFLLSSNIFTVNLTYTIISWLLLLFLKNNHSRLLTIQCYSCISKREEVSV